MIETTSGGELVGKIQFRVRYQETDQMGVVYHGNYFAYFEMGRTELLREATGFSYRDIEESNVKLVVARAECSYIKPARYDDLLTLETRLAVLSRASLTHEYALYRDSELLAKGLTKLVAVDDFGKIVPVPKQIATAVAPDKAKNRGKSESKEEPKV
ncbi:MAG: acyl-CoA thioesterase [Thermoguttaceae bacterium]|nr:acyl-CoA thioesterase [Thermoguttaceae bacterium]